MKKVISVFVSIVLIASVVSVGFTAEAAGWVSYAKNIQLDTVFSDEGSKSDYYQNDYYYDVFKFTVPEKGIIDFHAEYENEISSYLWFRFDLMKLEFYNCKDLDNPIWEYERGKSYDTGYSSGRGVNYYKWKFTLPAGEYFFVIGYESDSEGALYEKIDYSLNYKPSFSNTSIKSLIRKNNAFKAKWKKASGVNGYQIQYSKKSNMRSSKKITVNKQSTVSKKIKKLKNKKKYYVRVRTYKKMKVEGVTNTYYGDWSAKKTVRTK